MKLLRKSIFIVLSYSILMIVFGFSPQAHSSGTTVFSCPCNDTKGWGDCARECCSGIARLCCSKTHESPEIEPLTKDKPRVDSLPKTEEQKYFPPPLMPSEDSLSPVVHPVRGEPKPVAPLNSNLASVRPTKKSVITTVKGNIEAGEEAEIMGGVIRGGARRDDLSIRTSIGGGIKATGKSKVTLGSEVG